MEENVQELLKDKNEDVVQFNFENNTSSPVAIDLFDTASLLTIPTSGTQQTTYTASNDLLASLPPSLFAQNPNNGTFIASDVTSGVLRLINTTTNTNESQFNNFIGFDNPVYSVLLQPDGKIICGGGFTTYKGFFTTENEIIRLNSDGTKDLTFDNSIGFPSGGVFSMALQPDGKILVGGGFTQYKGLTENYIIRLNSDGTKDLTFDNSIGFDTIVFSIAIQSDGKILVGGLFTTYKGVSENYIIRLNTDGTKDLTFDNSIGFDNAVLSIAIQPDGKILVGGQFTTYKGVSANNIIRLNSDGSKDLTFDNSIGFNYIFTSYVTSVTLQSDGKIICGGQFTTYKGVSANRIIRLNSDGSKDLTFDNSIGFDASVESIELQPDGKILCGGFFTTYKGLSENRIIRLNSDGSKDLTFDNSIGFDGNPATIKIKPNGNLIIGGQFTTYKNYSNEHIIELQSNGNSASTLNIGGGGLLDIMYNSNNNIFYASTGGATYVISADGQTIQSTIFPAPASSITYNVNNNYLYLLWSNYISVVNCSTNLIVSTIPLTTISATGFSQVTPSNEIYFFDNVTGLLEKIDCSTNLEVLINLSLPNITSNVNSINYNNGYLYITSSTSNIIDIVDANTETYFTSITIPAIYNLLPNYVEINPTTNQLFITDSNATNQKQFAVIDFNSNSLVSVNSIGSIGATYGVIYNSITNSMYISGSLFSVVTFTATPFFIGGSTNYNTFVNSLNFEPIFIEEIRILTQSQTQLYNQVQFTKIDSNGNQIFFPEFPITKVDSYQQQGNIAELKLNGLVFDGRTYINQYVINANQIVSFEIYYKQLDRFSATPTFPIFFKEKVQLKEYIRKDYNNYDVEM
jgi:uncharacterized delta-60 repeat protein